MKCLSPVTIKNPNFHPDSAELRYLNEPRYIEVPCGKCYNCLRKRANEWVFRLEREMRYHLCATFLTLTYDDEHLPKDGSLNYRHVQLYYKRLRKTLNFRHFTIGEYGPENLRPHYHAILFGLSPDDELFLKEKWPYGFIKLGKVTSASINYVAGYCCKNAIDYSSLGLARQFTRCSIRPAIGFNYCEQASVNILKKKAMLLTPAVFGPAFLDTTTRNAYLSFLTMSEKKRKLQYENVNSNFNLATPLRRVRVLSRRPLKVRANS